MVTGTQQNKYVKDRVRYSVITYRDEARHDNIKICYRYFLKLPAVKLTASPSKAALGSRMVNG